MSHHEEFQTNPETEFHRQQLRQERRTDLLYGYGLLLPGLLLLLGSGLLLILSHEKSLSSTQTVFLALVALSGVAALLAGLFQMREGHKPVRQREATNNDHGRTTQRGHESRTEHARIHCEQSC